jgi:hypothetical protein
VARITLEDIYLQLTREGHRSGDEEP